MAIAAGLGVSRALAIAFVALTFATNFARADDEEFVREQTLGKPSSGGSNSPYIDKLKQTMEPRKPEENDSFIERKKREMREADPQTQLETGNINEPPTDSKTPYIDKIRKTDPRGTTPERTDGYTESERQKLPVKESGGAIARVREGKSELEKKKEGEPNRAFSLRMGAVTQDPKITGDAASQANSFEGIYGKKRWFPNFSFHYEYDLFNHPYTGAFGLFTQISAATLSGWGHFGANLPGFGQTSRVAYRFWILPWTVGALYRFNAFKYVKPYVMGGPSLIAYTESRDDGGRLLYGYSRGYTVMGGVAVQLDWLSDESDWELYANYGIHHIYLVAEVTHTGTIASPVSITLDGFNLGFLFEF